MRTEHSKLFGKLVDSSMTLYSYAPRLKGTILSLAEDLTEKALATCYYRWPCKLLFIAGLPKSGTSWLRDLLAEVPGYRVRRFHDPCGCWFNHDVCDDIFGSLPQDRYTVLKSHTRCTKQNLEVINRFDLRTVVMYRDLRDQCISRYYHVLNDPTHRHHGSYMKALQEEGISHCIEIVLEEYVVWVRDWLPIISGNHQRFCEVRYEDLRADPIAVLLRVLAFYEIYLSRDRVREMVAAVRKRTKFDLKINLKEGTGTARKGMVGDWRNHFTPKHVERFKEGCGEFLIQLGYEKDLDWDH